MKEEKRNKIISIILVISVLSLMVGVTYAAFIYTGKGTKENSITTSNVSFIYNETSNGVSLTDAYPMEDVYGKNLTDSEGTKGYFDFEVKSTIGADTIIPYYVYAVDISDEENKLDPEYVKLYLTNQQNEAYERYKEEVPTYVDLDDVEGPEEVQGKLLYQDTFYESGVKDFRLRMWVSNKYTPEEVSKQFKLRVDVSTDAKVIPKDKEAPTCTIENINKNNPTIDEDITMNIKCSDSSGVTSTMTKDDVHVLVDGSEVTPTKKELTEGIAVTDELSNEIQHTLTINGFEKSGKISIKINSGVVKDKYNNTNEELTLDPNINLSKRVKVTLVKGSGVESISPDQTELTCDITSGDSCSVTLPTITPKTGYDAGYWTENQEQTAGVTGEVQVSNDTTYYAKANDTTPPVCKVYNAETKDIEKTGKAEVQIDCTDTSGVISKDIEENNITTLIDGNEVTVEKSITNQGIENGKRYTVSLNGFTNLGPLTLKLADSSVTDESGNGNEETDITTNLTINETLTVKIIKGTGVEEVDTTDLTCKIKKDKTSCNVTLPDITPLTGYDEPGYYTEDQEQKTGEVPGEISINSNKTYYAKANDTTPPVCSLNSATPTEPTTAETVTIKIDCTDTSGSLKTDLTTDSLEIKVAEAVVSPTKSLTDTTSITNGKQYTITLSGFTTTGALVLTIAPNAVTDNSGNGNISTTITPSVTIKSPGINGVPTNDSGASYSNATKDKMFEFTHDGHTEYRYIGNTDKNYVNLIGGADGKKKENLWRIIGVFDNPSATESETTGAKKIKLILDEKLNNTNYSWDNNGSDGSNNWTRPAALNTALNQTFWNSTSGTCPSGSSTTACDFKSYKISSVQSKIENMKWYLGAVDSKYNTYSTEKFYSLERGSTAAGGGGATTTTGHVGLIYPSDYGYTYSKGVSDKCFNAPGGGGNCTSTEAAKGWMYKSAYHWWLQSPWSGSTYNVFFVLSDGFVAYNHATMANIGVRPVVYLKSNIGITGGEGTTDEPYTVGDTSSSSSASEPAPPPVESEKQTATVT